MKGLFIFIPLFFSFSNLFAQPSNDDCSGIIDLGTIPICPHPDTFTNFGATKSIPFTNPSDNLPSCFTGGVINRDVWFQFLVPPDGSVVDFTIELTGVNGPNGSIVQPQIAVYRGDCLIDGLAELFCATAAPGETEVSIELVGTTPGLPLFLRISDWSASGTPNWGDFQLCVKPFDPVFNMGEESSTTSCFGTLYDAGGPNADYPSGQNNSFTVCPQIFTECIAVDIVLVSTEEGFDFLRVFAGDDTNSPLLANFDAYGTNVQLQVPGQCVTFQFISDGSIQDEGFELNWQCQASPCNIAPPSTCSSPTIIPSLPYSASGLTTCNAQNSVNTSPCDDNDWMQGEDVIFTYTSLGDECISVNISGSNGATAVGIFDDCPEMANNCISVEGGEDEGPDPVIEAAFLPTADTYYIVVDNPIFCTPFNIEINEVTCPVIMPSAAFCEDAQLMNGCGNEPNLPSTVNIAPGQGDPDFLEDNINIGCWGGIDQPNFTFFYFQAQTNGEFAFVIESANIDEASDIDFQVWGPLASVEELCSFAANNQPIRSSYAQGAEPTGLAHINPLSGQTVTDTCEQAGFPPLGGDGFLTPIDVEIGKYYLVMINDYGGDIESGAISIDFSNTSTGVLDPIGFDFSVTQGTIVCPGDSVQLEATGGDVFQWINPDGLDCQYCPNPVATPDQSITYSVAVSSLCISDTLEVKVDVLNVDAGSDITICLNEDIQIVAGSDFSNISYQWTGPAGFLSCSDCASPIVTGTQAGSYSIIVSALGSNCSSSDTMQLTVLPDLAPTFQIAPDQFVCGGTTVSLGGTAVQGVSYAWSSSPQGFFSDQSNPSDSPTQTTTYYLQATNSQCPTPSLDSVVVTVSELPVFVLENDTTICLGQSVQLSNSIPESGVVYEWSPSIGLSNPNSLNTLAAPTQPTTYTLTASRMGCQRQESINIGVVTIDLGIQNIKPTEICRGTSLPLTATVNPPGTTISWTPNDGSLSTNTGPNVIATPTSTTNYIASATIGQCVLFDTFSLIVDSLPWNIGLTTTDTIICEGELVQLNSSSFEPSAFTGMQFQWSGDGLLTLTDLPNALVQPTETTTYYRLTTNGACSVIDSVTVFVSNSPSLTVSPDTILNCGTSSIQLFAQASEPGGTYEWSDGSTIQNPVFELGIGVNEFSIVYTSVCGETVTETVEVNVFGGPNVEITNVTDSVFQGTEIVLAADSMNAVSILWSNGSISDTAIVSPVSLPTTTYWVAVTDEFGCVASDTLVLEVLEPLFEIPNAFSPNGDNTNEVFNVVVLGETIVIQSMKIWNRWGQLVFESKNSNEGWDGNKGGKPSPSDVYIYSIQIKMPDGKELKRKGDVTLLR